MTDFVLVHGAWHGGWCWRHVADRLAAAGHRVLTPTLTGQGDRHHLLDAGTDTATHVADILAVLEREGVQDAVLVGHSYGARPTALASGHPAVAQWISLDGVWVTPGEALMDGTPPAMVEATRAALIDGIGAPPLPAEVIGVPVDHPLHGWVAQNLTPMAWRVLEEPLPPVPPRFADLPKAYVAALGNRLDGPKRGLEQARAEGWPVIEIDSGHDLMVTAPDETADALLRLAGQRER
ncbi:MAG: alpha/beta fold hydrolase [Sphingomonadaceae bacterium]